MLNGLQLGVFFLSLSAILQTALTLSVHGVFKRSHSDLAKRQGHNATLSKRASGQATFYDVQTGNEVYCGGHRSNSEFIVAIALERISADRSLCGKPINIFYKGKTISATIQDGCAGCSWDDVDLTIDCFQAMEDLGAGRVPVTWEFAGAAPPPPPPPPPPTLPPPPPSPTPAPKPFTATLPSSYAHPSSSAASSAVSHSSVSASASVASSLPTSGSNIIDLYQVFVQMGGVVVAGPKAA